MARKPLKRKRTSGSARGKRPASRPSAAEKRGAKGTAHAASPRKNGAAPRKTSPARTARAASPRKNRGASRKTSPARTARAASRRKNGAAPRKTAPARPTRRIQPRSGAEAGERQPHPGRPEQREAFFADARHATDALAEELGESFVLSATGGEDPEEHYDRELPDEDGGPFLETSGRTEFGYGVDESNPEDAEPSPLPSVSPEPPRPYRPGGPR